jgi:hypothetical protein
VDAVFKAAYEAELWQKARDALQLEAEFDRIESNVDQLQQQPTALEAKMGKLAPAS